MRIQVFISESRVSRKKFTEEMKPRERLAYLKQYPKSSFAKITDAKGKLTDETSKKKPKLVKKVAKGTIRKNAAAQAAKKPASKRKAKKIGNLSDKSQAAWDKAEDKMRSKMKSQITARIFDRDMKNALEKPTTGVIERLNKLMRSYGVTFPAAVKKELATRAN